MQTDRRPVRNSMADREAFHRSVAAAPQDMAPKGAFADWLAEQGDTTHEAIVRASLRPRRDGDPGHGDLVVFHHGDELKDLYTIRRAAGTTPDHAMFTWHHWLPAEEQYAYYAGVMPMDQAVGHIHDLTGSDPATIRELGRRLRQREQTEREFEERRARGRRRNWRDGTPVRNAMQSDIQALHAAVSANPLDHAPWGVLADALDEAGKPHVAHVCRTFALHGEQLVHQGTPYPYLVVGDPIKRVGDIGDDYASGHVHGVPVHVWNLANGGGFNIGVNHPPENRDSTWNMARGIFPAEVAAGLIHEMEPKTDEGIEAANAQRLAGLKAKYPVQMARQPVRNAMQSDIQALHAAVAENPHDRAGWGVLADALDEAGHSHTATAFRTLATQGAPDKNLHGSPVMRHDGTGDVHPGPWEAGGSGHVGGVHIGIDRNASGSYLMTVRTPKYPHYGIASVWLPEQQGAGIVHEMTPHNPWHQPGDHEAQIPNNRQVEQLKAKSPVPMRRPVRNSMADGPAFVRAIAANHLDRAPWGAFADYLDEQGKSHTAAALRLLATKGEDFHPSFGWPSLGYDVDGLEEGTHYETGGHGHVHGMGFTLARYSDGTHYLSVDHPDRPSGSLSPSIAWGFFPEDIGAGMAHEMEPHTSYGGDHGRQVNQTGVERMRAARPMQMSMRDRPKVKMAMRSDHQAFQNAIAANPDDAAPLGVYADALDEEGHQHMATAYRKAAEFVTRVSLHGYGPVHSPYGASVGSPTYDGHHPSSGADVTVQMLPHPTPLARVNLFTKDADLGGYVSDDVEHLKGLLGEIGADEPTGQFGTERHRLAVWNALGVGNDVTARRNRLSMRDRLKVKMAHDPLRPNPLLDEAFGVTPPTPPGPPFAEPVRHPKPISVTRSPGYHPTPPAAVDPGYEVLPDDHPLPPPYAEGVPNIEKREFAFTPPKPSLRERIRRKFRLSRSRLSQFATTEPVRLSADTEGLHRRIAGNPLDRAPWFMLSDAFLEAEKPWAAHVARKVAMGVEEGSRTYKTLTGGVGLRSKVNGTTGNTVRGHIEGIPIATYPMGRENHFFVGLGQLGEGGMPAAYAYLEPHEAEGILHEMTPNDAQDAQSLNAHRSRFMSHDLPEKMSRAKVKLSRTDIDGLHNAVSANPLDRAPWGMLADAMDEAGKPHTAHVLRTIATRGLQFLDRPTLFHGSTSFGDLDGFAPGQVHGVGMEVWGRPGGFYIGVPHPKNKPSHYLMGFGEFPDEVGRGVLHEMEEHPSDLGAITDRNRRYIAEMRAKYPVPMSLRDRLKVRFALDRSLAKLAEKAPTPKAGEDVDPRVRAHAGDVFEKHGLIGLATAARGEDAQAVSGEEFRKAYSVPQRWATFTPKGWDGSVFVSHHEDQQGRPLFMVTADAKGPFKSQPTGLFFHKTRSAKLVARVLKELSDGGAVPRYAAEDGRPFEDPENVARIAADLHRSVHNLTQPLPAQMSMRGKVRKAIRMSKPDFLRAIRSAPQDDAPKLVYADWLDEQGHAEQAAAVRQLVGHADAGLHPDALAPLLDGAGVHGWRTMPEWQPLIDRQFAANPGGGAGWNAPADAALAVRAELIRHLREVGDPRASIVARDTAAMERHIAGGGAPSWHRTPDHGVFVLSQQFHDTGEGINPDRHAYGRPLSAIEVNVQSKGRRGRPARQPSTIMRVGWYAHTSSRPIFSGRPEHGMTSFPVVFERTMGLSELRNFADTLPEATGASIHKQLDQFFPRATPPMPGAEHRTPPERMTMRDRFRKAVRMAAADDIPILRGIAANPWDNQPHAVLADSLDDQGSPFAHYIREYATGRRDNSYWNWRESDRHDLDPDDLYDSGDNYHGFTLVGQHGPFDVSAQPSGFGGKPDAPLRVVLSPSRGRLRFHYNLELTPHETHRLAESLGSPMGDNLRDAARHQWHGLGSADPMDRPESRFPAYDQIVASPEPEPERMARRRTPQASRNLDALMVRLARDRDAEALVRHIATNPLDRGPWAALSDRALEIGKPWLAHVTREMSRAEDRDRVGNLAGAHYRRDPMGVYDRPYSDYPHPRVRGYIAGIPVSVAELPGEASWVLLQSHDHFSPIDLGTISVPPHVGAGILHEIDAAHPAGNYAHILAEAQARNPHPGDPSDHGLKLSMRDRVRRAIRMARDPNKPSKYGCALLKLDGEIADKVLAIAATLKDEDLADDGRSDDAHCTILYGFEPSEDLAEQVQRIAHEFGRPIKGKVTKLSAFLGADSGKDYDVLKFDVESDDLHELNEMLGRLPHKKTHAEYHPHVTCGYVKAGLAEKYIDGETLDLPFEVDHFFIAGTDRKKKPVSLRPGVRIRGAVKNARLADHEVHPEFKPGGVAPRLGHLLQSIAAETPDGRETDHTGLARAALAAGPDDAHLGMLADALEEKGHPLAGDVDWRAAGRGMRTDRALLTAIQSLPRIRGGAVPGLTANPWREGALVYRSVSPGFVLSDWTAGVARPRLPKRRALAVVRQAVPDADVHDLHHSIVRLLDHQFIQSGDRDPATMSGYQADRAREDAARLGSPGDPTAYRRRRPGRMSMRDRFRRKVRMSRSDVAGLVRAAHAAPADDAPKLVLADALTENGHSGVADVLRLGTGHAKSPLTMAGGDTRLTDPSVRLVANGLLVGVHPALSIQAPEAGWGVKRSWGRHYRVQGQTWLYPGAYFGVYTHGVDTAGTPVSRRLTEHYTHDPELIRRVLTEFGPPPRGQISDYRRLLHRLQPLIGDTSDLAPPIRGRQTPPAQMSLRDRFRAKVRLSQIATTETVRMAKTAPTYPMPSAHQAAVKEAIAAAPGITRDELWKHPANRRVTGGAFGAVIDSLVQRGHVREVREDAGAGKFRTRYYPATVQAPPSTSRLDRIIGHHKEGLSGGEIGRKLGITRQRVSQAIATAKMKGLLARDGKPVRMAMGEAEAKTLLRQYMGKRPAAYTGWVNPEGEFHPLGDHALHEDWVKANGFRDLDHAYQAGWVRVLGSGRTLYSENPHRMPNRKQRDTLDMTAMRNGLHEIVHDTGGGSRTLWAKDRFEKVGTPVKMAMDPAMARRAGENPADHGVWHVYADMMEENGFPALARATRTGTYLGAGYDAEPASVQSWERPDTVEAMSFPVWHPTHNLLTQLRYYPAQKTAMLRLRTRASYNEEPGSRRMEVSPETAHALAAELEAHHAADPHDQDEAHEYTAVRKAIEADHPHLAGPERMSMRDRLKARFAAMRDRPKRAHEMTYWELRQALEPATKADMAAAQPLVREVFPEWTETDAPDSSNDYAFGAWHMAHRGNEIHRLPFVDLSERHRGLVQRALDAGLAVPPEVLAESHVAGKVGPGRMARSADAVRPARLAAMRDRPVSPAGAQGRVGTANHQTLIRVLKDVLDRSGLSPHHVWPAVHEVGPDARAAVVAAAYGEKKKGAGEYGAAWQGLVGHMPNLVVFRSHPEGADSVYRFAFKGPTSAMSQLLDAAGVRSRVFVPHGPGTHVFLYDKGRALRPAVGDLVSRLNLQAVEHTGTGNPVGGGDDLGRADYRDTINAAEAGTRMSMRHRFRRAVRMSHDAFTRSILANPNDTAPGLVYADWLDENGASKLAALYRHPTGPGSLTAELDEDAWDASRWARLADAMKEAGKQGTGNAIADLGQRGKPVGGHHPSWSDKPFEKALWQTDIPDFSMRGTYDHSVLLHVAGLKVLMHPYAVGYTGSGPQPFDPARPTHFFTRFLSQRKLPYSTNDPNNEPQHALGGVFVPRHRAEMMMREADGFETPEHATAAAAYLKHPTARLSMRDRARRAVRMSRQDIQGLLANLQANPADHGVRLILADAMAEEGRQHEEAALRSNDPVAVWRTHGNPSELRLRRGDAGIPIPHSTEWRRRPTGAWLDADVPERVRETLLEAVVSRRRVHLSHGNPETGRDHLEEHANHGELYVPNPWYGTEPPPPGRGSLMINYGRGMFSHMPVYGSRIVRIRALPSGGNLYRHPTYHHGEIQVRPFSGWDAIDGHMPPRVRPAFEVAVDGKPHAGFNTERAARMWVKKMGLSPATARPPEPTQMSMRSRVRRAIRMAQGDTLSGTDTPRQVFPVASRLAQNLHRTGLPVLAGLAAGTPTARPSGRTFGAASFRHPQAGWVHIERTGEGTHVVTVHGPLGSGSWAVAPEAAKAVHDEVSRDTRPAWEAATGVQRTFGAIDHDDLKQSLGLLSLPDRAAGRGVSPRSPDDIPTRPAVNRSPGRGRFRRAALKFNRSNHEAFRRAIDANPHDQAPWLVYADYLDESGMSSHAHHARTLAGKAFPVLRFDSMVHGEPEPDTFMWHPYPWTDALDYSTGTGEYVGLMHDTPEAREGLEANYDPLRHARDEAPGYRTGWAVHTGHQGHDDFQFDNHYYAGRASDLIDLMAQHHPHRMSMRDRVRRAVRMSRENIDGVLRQMSSDDNHTDLGMWGILADAFRDEGLNATGDAVGHLMHGRHSQYGGFFQVHADPANVRGIRFETNPTGHIEGSVAGMPVKLESGSSRLKTGDWRQAWVLGVYKHPDAHDLLKESQPQIARVWLPHEAAVGVMREMTPRTGGASRWERDLHLMLADEKAAEKLSRGGKPVKMGQFAMPDTGFAGHLAHAAPQDDAPWLVYADHLDESGLGTLAHVIRAEQQIPLPGKGRPPIVGPGAYAGGNLSMRFDPKTRSSFRTFVSLRTGTDPMPATVEIHHFHDADYMRPGQHVNGRRWLVTDPQLIKTLAGELADYHREVPVGGKSSAADEYLDFANRIPQAPERMSMRGRFRARVRMARLSQIATTETVRLAKREGADYDSGWVPVDSSWIGAVRQLPGNTVGMETKQGKRYYYRDIAAGLMKRWAKAGSPGKFWHANVGPVYGPAETAEPVPVQNARERFRRAIRLQRAVKMNRDEFLRQIQATPADDAPKLVYADWLDEQGHSGPAAAIRQHLGHTDSDLDGNAVLSGLIAAGLHPIAIPDQHGRHTVGRPETIGHWDYYDMNQGPDPFPQSVLMHAEEYDPEPDNPHSQPATVYRWVNHDPGGPTDFGPWSLDPDEARDGGQRHIEKSEREVVEDLGYDPKRM